MTEKRTLTIAGVERELVTLCAEQANREQMPVREWIERRLREAVEKAEIAHDNR